MLDDLRHSLHSLRRSPGFAALSLLTLTLGIAASAAAFTLLYAVVLRPLPFPHSDRLVFLHGRALTTSNFSLWRQRTTTYSAMAAMDPGIPNIDTPDGPERVRSLLVSPEFFPLLGLNASAGRTLLPEDFRPDSSSVVLSDRLASRLFGSPAAALGRTVHLVGTGYYNESFLIVGTLAFTGPLPYDDISIVQPILPLPRAELTSAIALLKPGATVAAARAEAQGLALGLAASLPPIRRGTFNVELEPLKDSILGDSALYLRLFFAAALLVLLITCANVAHLVLARSAVRLRDVAVRLALGASRLRLARELVCESLLISLAATAAGLWLSSIAVRLLIARAPYEIPRLGDAHTSAAVVAFSLLIAILTAVAFALAPLFAVRGLDLNHALKEGSHQVAGASRQRWFRSLLISSEIAIACVVLVVAGLLVETFLVLQPAHPGFNPHDKLILRLGNTQATNRDSVPLVAALQSRLSALHGVNSVAAAITLPMTIGAYVPDVRVGGLVIAGGASPNAVNVRAVSANFFSTMQMPLSSGRAFTAADESQALPVALVNQEFVRRFLNGVEPLGQRAAIVSGGSGSGPSSFQIIGVLHDARIYGFSTAFRPEMYIPFSTDPARGFYIVVDTSTDPLLVASDVRHIVRQLAPGAVVTEMQTMDQLLAHSVAEPRFQAFLLGILAALAVLLALAGIYAVMSYSVAQRRHEMGVRLAVGAQAAHILALVLRSALRLTVIGVVAGVAAALLISRALTSILYGTAPADPRSYLAAAVLLLLLAAAAAFAPALRASRVNPTIALRAD